MAQSDRAHGDAELHLGDCLEILPTLGKVEAVVTAVWDCRQVAGRRPAWLAECGKPRAQKRMGRQAIRPARNGHHSSRR